jgi:hypothetical protein
MKSNRHLCITDYRGVLPVAQRQPLEHKQKCGEMSLTARVIKIDTVSVVYVCSTGAAT